ncbi:hypothetical protein ACH419_37125 [Streptomyces bobili]|uniref:hypothetical protein n=1 Tax=Streptomyces bobili TaxID=67280 RepID=UPI00378F8457
MTTTGPASGYRTTTSAPAPVRFDVDYMSSRVRRLYELTHEAPAAGRAASSPTV